MIATFPDLSSLLHGTIEGFLASPSCAELVTESEALTFDNLLRSESMTFRLDIGRDLYLPLSRWSKLIRAYLDPSSTHRFLSTAKAIALGESKKGAVTSLLTQPVRTHRFGNCLLGFSFRGPRDQPTFSMHSRMAYISYIGALDLALAYTLAREISQRIETPISQFRFAWHADCLSFHAYKSLPLLFSRLSSSLSPLPPSRKDRNPTQRLVGDWWDRLSSARLNGSSNFGPVRRISAAYSQFKQNRHPASIPVRELTLDALTR